MRNILLACLGICLAVAATFRGAIHNEVVADDRQNLMFNPYMADLAGPQVAPYWTSGYAGLYIPVFYTVLATELKVFGRHEQGRPTFVSREAIGNFHKFNIALHMVNAILVLMICRAVFGSTLFAFIGALLFAVHSYQAEVVAWITGQKDLISNLFALSFVLFHLATRKKGRPFASFLVLFVFQTLAILAKPAAGVAPVLAVIVVMIGGFKLERRDYAALSLVLLLVPAGLVTIGLQGTSADLVFFPTFWQRIVLALDSVTAYGVKFFYPSSPWHMFFERKPYKVLEGDWLWLTVPLPILAMIAAAAKGSQKLMLCFIFVGVALLPTLGLVSSMQQNWTMCTDRYMYLAMVGPALLLAACRSRKLAGLAIILVIFSALLSREVTAAWKSDDTLADYRLGRSLAAGIEDSWTFTARGYIALKANRDDEAMAYYAKALKYDNRDMAALHDMVLVYVRHKRFDDAALLIAEARRRLPGNSSVQYVQDFLDKAIKEAH